MMQFFFVCGTVVSYMAFVLSLFVPHLFCRCLGKAQDNINATYETTDAQTKNFNRGTALECLPQ